MENTGKEMNSNGHLVSLEDLVMVIEDRNEYMNESNVDIHIEKLNEEVEVEEGEWITEMTEEKEEKQILSSKDSDDSNNINDCQEYDDSQENVQDSQSQQISDTNNENTQSDYYDTIKNESQDQEERSQSEQYQDTNQDYEQNQEESPCESNNNDDHSQTEQQQNENSSQLMMQGHLIEQEEEEGIDIMLLENEEEEDDDDNQDQDKDEEEDEKEDENEDDNNDDDDNDILNHEQGWEQHYQHLLNQHNSFTSFEMDSASEILHSGINSNNLLENHSDNNLFPGINDPYLDENVSDSQQNELSTNNADSNSNGSQISNSGFFVLNNLLHNNGQTEGSQRSIGFDNREMIRHLQNVLVQNLANRQSQIGLTEQQIERITVIKHSTEEHQEHKQCSICLSEFVDQELIMLLNCTHPFHKDCITQWFINKSSCPCCRSIQH